MPEPYIPKVNDYDIWDKGEYASIVIDPSVDVHEYNQKKF